MPRSPDGWAVSGLLVKTTTPARDGPRSLLHFCCGLKRLRGAFVRRGQQRRVRSALASAEPN